MSYSNTTTNYQFPQFLSYDQPGWLTDMNEFFNKLDGIIHEIEVPNINLDDYQPKLESGVNINTINGASLLTGNNIQLQTPLVSGENIKTINGQDITGAGNLNIDTSGLNANNINTINNQSLVNTTGTPTNIPVQEPLVSGTSIKTINGTSLLGSGNINLSTDVDITANNMIISPTTITGDTSLHANQTITGLVPNAKYIVFANMETTIVSTSTSYYTGISINNGVITRVRNNTYVNGMNVVTASNTGTISISGYMELDGISGSVTVQTGRMDYCVLKG